MLKPVTDKEKAERKRAILSYQFISEKKMKIGHSRCKCAACGEYFNSVHAFEKHRKGNANARYCDTSEMVKNNSDYWVTGLRDETPPQSKAD